jgi:hypothetical protein
MVALHGAFFGCLTPAARIEAMIAAHIPKLHITEVAEVYQHKWWDYRRLSPGHSFMLFAHYYYRGFKVAARKMLAHRKCGQGKIGLMGFNEIEFNSETIWDRPQIHLTGLWKAMLTADSLGMPYDTFTQLAFGLAIDNLWERLPQPRQLYSEKLAAMTVMAWDDLRKDRLMFAKHPLYLVDNYVGAPVQDAYRDWLIGELKEMDNLVNPLAEVVYRRPQLPEAVAQANFPAHVLNRARLLTI